MLALAALVGVSTPALAHDELINTEILTGENGVPAEAVQLTFNNSVLEVGTEIVITGPDGSDATDGDPVTDGPHVTQQLAADLSAGDYQGAWRVVSSDGHPIEGAFVIAIAEDGTSELRDGSTGDDGTSEETGEETADTEDEGTVTTQEAVPADEESESDEAGSAWLIVVAVLLAIAVIAVVISIIVGQRKRSRAISEAATPPPGEDRDEN